MATQTVTQTVQAKAVLDSLPDLIRDAVLELGIKLDNAVPSAEQPTTCFNYIPPDLKAALQQGNHQKIQEINRTAAKDMDPIYANMRQNEDRAWVQIENKSDKTPYWISIAGSDPQNPTGYMWTYTNPKPVATTDANGDPGYIHTVQVGTLSRNSKLLGISNQLWDNKALSVTAAVISSIVTAVMTRYISGRIAGTAFGKALSDAALRAGASLIARGVVTQAGWLAGGAFAAKFVGGAVAGAALTLLIMFIAEFVYREYKCCINIYNWTSKPLTVDSFWGSNEKIDDDQDFVRAALPGRAASIVLPDGMSGPVVGEAAVSYCTYVFVNDNKFLEGLGVAMQVVPGSDNKGVLLGYYLGRFNKNKLALSANTSQSLQQFYNNGSDWAPDGSLKWSIKLSDGTPVTCSTSALSGRDDQFYEYNVCIGLAPTSNFADELPQAPPPPPRPVPVIPRELFIGDKISLNGESTVTVVGKLCPSYLVTDSDEQSK